MKSPLDVLREANKRKRSPRIETPLDFIRSLNRKKRRRVTTQKILKRLEHATEQEYVVTSIKIKQN